MFFFRILVNAFPTSNHIKIIKLFLLSVKTKQKCMPTQPRSQWFFPNSKRLVGEESIALH